MDDKKQKSIDDINKRVRKLEGNIIVPLDLDYMSILLKGKSPQYYVRFAAWARNTLDKDEHMDNFVQALISHCAVQCLTQKREFTEDYVSGMAAGILFLYEEMQRLSNVNQFINNSKEEK